MAKYSDIINLSDFLPIYDILDENPNSWKSFIPTNQFCELLNRSLTAITSTELSKRKSVWVRGTFGTGKSHASAVVKHLLCDEFSQIEGYLSNIDNIPLREKIRNIRQSKKYFAVTLKGVEGAYDIPRFSLTLQRETQKALSVVAPDFVVQSSFRIAIDWIEEHRDIFKTAVLDKSDELNSMVDTIDEVILRLNASDTSVYLAVEEALRECISVSLRHPNISDWLVEVEQEIERRGIANGLILFWDEFTSVMDTLKSDRINVLQNIAEKTQKNNIYLFLISHRTESQSLDIKGKDITKMSDRFDDIPYAMDEISTYLIMRHSFNIVSSESIYSKLQQESFGKMDPLFNFLCPFNAEERRRIENLFPLHPYTAFLCSTISNFVGSSNRTVVKFMHDDANGFGAFLEDENAFVQRMNLTADSLWDYFYEYFEKDSSCSTFVNTYKAHIDKVYNESDDHVRVFKAILLLNALAPKFNGKNNLERITPNEKTIRYIFFGDRVENKIGDILKYLDSNKIVVKNIFDEFKINASAYNPSQVQEEKNKIMSSYKTSVDVLNYNASCLQDLKALFASGDRLYRMCEPQFYASEEAEALIRSKLNKYVSQKANHLHIVVFLSVDEITRDNVFSRIKQFSQDFQNTILLLPEETLSQERFNKFIDCLTTANVAKMNFNKGEEEQYKKEAETFVEKWILQLSSSPYTLYFNGKSFSEGDFSEVADYINRKISAQIFTKGFETVKQFSNGEVVNTFFKIKKWDALALQAIQAQMSDHLLTYGGDSGPARFIFEDNGIRLITSNCSLSDNAKAGTSWIAEVCKIVDHCMNEARKKYTNQFYLSDVLEPLMLPPYGFFPSKANFIALAYALRTHKSDLFEPRISQPISDQTLQDIIHRLFVMWETGKTEQHNKVLLRFGSPEEKQLTERLIDVFDLKQVKGVNVNEIRSLENVKWAIQEYCKVKSMYPLWTLTYCTGISDQSSSDISEIIKLFATENPSVEKIKELYRRINLNKIELNIIVTKASNYENGFKNFVETIEEAEIKSEWWDEMMKELDTMPSEIAFRRMEDVRQRIVAFSIRKNKVVPATSEASIESTTTSTPQVTVEPSLVDKAKASVKKANMPNMFWQQMLLELIDEHPVVSEYLSKYLS